MPHDEQSKVVTTMRLPTEMIKKLDAEATGMGWSRTTLVTQALAKFLAERGNATSVRVVLG